MSGNVNMVFQGCRFENFITSTENKRETTRTSGICLTPTLEAELQRVAALEGRSKSAMGARLIDFALSVYDLGIDSIYFHRENIRQVINDQCITIQ